MNKRNRIKATQGEAIYHCMSRILPKHPAWDIRDKEIMRQQIWLCAESFGVEILTYCIMDDHFHLLVRIPDKNTQNHTDAELLSRYRILYPRPTSNESARIRYYENALDQGGAPAQAARHQLQVRMHEVSHFIKTLKQRFSSWYNRTHARIGTHWDERYLSVFVENIPIATGIMAAYIDLNAVRAGAVKDPKDYAWCGYTEALAGNPRARQGLIIAHGLEQQSDDAYPQALEQHRNLLFGDPADGDTPNLAPTQAREILAQGGKLPLSQLLRCHLPQLTSGLIFGTQPFVTAHLNEYRRQRKIRYTPKPPLPLPANLTTPLMVAKNPRRRSRKS